MMIYTGTYQNLKELFDGIGGEWDEKYSDKKVYRANGGLMNWYVTSGKINFQGKQEGKEWLEAQAKAILANLEAVDPLSKDHLGNSIANPPPHSHLKIPSHSSIETDYLTSKVIEGELVIGIVAAVGTESKLVIGALIDRLNLFGYKVKEIRVSSILKKFVGSGGEYERIRHYMQCGDSLRGESSNNAILAAGVASKIKELRDDSEPKRAYIVNSLKHPDEVEMLRKLYGPGFCLIGIHADEARRHNYLTQDKGCESLQAEELIKIDENESISYGQKTRDTYHLADFFLSVGNNSDQVKNRLQRFLELVFSHPYKNPTFDEYAMFMAFNSSATSGDLSRQVGAVVAKENQVVATGANDVPKAGGGLYWATVDLSNGEVIDDDDGKDYKRGCDSNKKEQFEIIESIRDKLVEEGLIAEEQQVKLVEILRKSQVSDLTEFGRIVHAEMDALTSCAREGISTRNTTLYCTTFPCHNCAKHIIASGIKRVVYVEPYPKSRALDFHSESIFLKSNFDNNMPDDPSSKGKVIFEPFIGVGPRRFLDLFSMNLGAGSKMKRKDKEGKVLAWDKSSAGIRSPLLPSSYLDIESAAIQIWNNHAVS